MTVGLELCPRPRASKWSEVNLLLFIAIYDGAVSPFDQRFARTVILHLMDVKNWNKAEFERPNCTPFLKRFQKFTLQHNGFVSLPPGWPYAGTLNAPAGRSKNCTRHIQKTHNRDLVLEQSPCRSHLRWNSSTKEWRFPARQFLSQVLLCFECEWIGSVVTAWALVWSGQ